MALNTVNANNLVSVLKQQQEKPNFFILTGTELQFHTEAEDLIRNIACDEKFYDCQEVYLSVDEHDLDVDDILDNANNPGIFHIKRFYKISFNKKPNASLLKSLDRIVKTNDNFHVYLFAFTGIPEREISSTAFYKQLQKLNHIAISCNKLNFNEYKPWIRQRLRNMKFQFDESVVTELAERFENNLTALQQILDQFVLRGLQELSVEAIEEASEMFADFTTNDLVISLLQGNVVKSNEILDHIINNRSESAILVIAMLRRELQLIYDLRVDNKTRASENFILQPLAFNGITEEIHQKLRQNYWDRRKRTLVEQAISTRFSRYHLYRLISLLTDIEIVSKTRDSNDKVIKHLKNFFLMFMGIIPLGSIDLFEEEVSL